MKSFKEFLKKLLKNKLFTLMLWALVLYLICDTISDSMLDKDAINRRFYNNAVEEAQKVPYLDFIDMMENGEISEVYYNTTNERMVAVKKIPEGEERDVTEEDCMSVLYPAGEAFRESMLSYGVELILIRNDDSGTIFLQLVLTMLPMAMIIGFYFLMFKKMNGTNDFEASSIIQKSDVVLDDIIGLDEIKEELDIIIKLISDPASGAALGAKIPHGILLSGPAGVGKTMIAKAISNAAGVPFISMNGSDFQELYVGNGARHVRQLFAIARKHSPCIVFIDEFDAIGTKRESVSSNSEDTKTINALLKEMDGFKPLDGVFVIAATNYSDKLDSSVTRSGRFDREVVITPPKDWEVRLELFKKYLGDKPLADDVDMAHVAKTVGGFTGADVAAVCNEAALVALSKGLPYITAACIDEAVDKKVFKGSYSKDKAYEPDRNIVAVHEAGHAVMAILLGQKVSRASIRSTTSGVGGAVFHEDMDSQFVTKKELEDRVKVCYAGRIAESIGFNSVTTGASNDIEQATSTLYAYVAKYGMFEDMGIFNARRLNELGVDSDDIVLDRINYLSRKLYDEAADLLSRNYELVRLLSEKLLEVEALSGDEIKEYLGLY